MEDNYIQQIANESEFRSSFPKKQKLKAPTSAIEFLRIFKLCQESTLGVLGMNRKVSLVFTLWVYLGYIADVYFSKQTR
jgi:hypothetical protein